MRKRNKEEDFGEFFCLANYLEHNIRLAWLWNLKSVVLDIIHKDSILKMLLTHFTSEGSPFDNDAVLKLLHI